MKARILIILAVLLGLSVALNAQDGQLHAKAFPGRDVGTMATNALAACPPTPAVPCYVILDASLAAFAPGTLPTPGANQFIVDFRTGWPGGGSGGSGAGSSSGQSAFNVKDFGAKGDGVTNDCAAVTSANNQKEAAGGGILFFPVGTFKLGSSCHFTFSNPTVVRGSGPCSVSIGFTCPSMISSSDPTGVLFTSNSDVTTFDSIGLINTSTTTAGAAVLANGANYFSVVNCQNSSIGSFWDDWDAWVGGGWIIEGCNFYNPGNDGISIQNLRNQDSGDWVIKDSFVIGDQRAGNSGVNVIGGNAGVIDNATILGAPSSPGIANGVLISACYSSNNSLTIRNSTIQEMQGPSVNLNGCSSNLFSNVQVINSDLAPVGFFPAILGQYINGLYVEGGQLAASPGQANIVLTNSQNIKVRDYLRNFGNTTPNSYTTTTNIDDTSLLNLSQQHGSIGFSTGNLTSVSTTQLFSTFLQEIDQPLSAVVVVASTFTCSGNPTVRLVDCGTGATCSPGTTVQSVAVSAGNTPTGNTSTATLLATHFYAWNLSGGTCTALTLSGSATY
ncbi:MAG TPA: glycosyl hydrolase family 28-related protein [Terracidiphilus sp.]|nr:glycosyl hydrolase family 28-related protein [Terracidiphilus sp.]